MSVTTRDEDPRVEVQGIQVPAMFYGTAWKEEHTRDLTLQALEAGFRGIDTANQRRHYVEAAVGEAIATFLESGTCQREDIFIQTKFTDLRGQDHRLPYDPGAALAAQVVQSMESSLAHLGVGRVDSYVLHGPASGRGWSAEDQEVWDVMTSLAQAGRTRLLGVSNVSLRHLEGLVAASPIRPAFVQNRCFARLGWDREVRAFCRRHGIIYQGFSLLTANPEVLGHSTVGAAARRYERTPAQIVLRFAMQVGVLVLTGTTDRAHMRQDLDCADFTLSEDEVARIESLVG